MRILRIAFIIPSCEIIYRNLLTCILLRNSRFENPHNANTQTATSAWVFAQGYSIGKRENQITLPMAAQIENHLRYPEEERKNCQPINN